MIIYDKERSKLLRDKAFDLVEKIDVDELTKDISVIELAYVLSFFDNIITVKANMGSYKQNNENPHSKDDRRI